jgi:serine O-acetyltransferase
MFDLIHSIQSRDPAKPTFMEVILGYNGFHAVVIHWASHWLWGLKLRALARFFANIGRMLTGVEIHPAAQIGARFFIDHGTGVVIGQTAVVGDDVTIYHGVTLGGVGRADDTTDKRHPTIENAAMIGSGAQILGNITIGAGAKIGSNSVVTTSIPAGCTAIGIPARIICKNDGLERGYGLPGRKQMQSFANLLDSVMADIDELRKKLDLPARSRQDDMDYFI